MICIVHEKYQTWHDDDMMKYKMKQLKTNLGSVAIIFVEKGNNWILVAVELINYCIGVLTLFIDIRFWGLFATVICYSWVLKMWLLKGNVKSALNIFLGATLMYSQFLIYLKIIRVYKSEFIDTVAKKYITKILILIFLYAKYLTGFEQ